MSTRQAVDLTNPFPGLRPFRTSEAEVYCGQEDQIDEVVYRLSRERFLALLGLSGTGKSSLINAGVLPRLDEIRLPNGKPRWLVARMNPGTAPIENLAQAVAKALARDIVKVREQLARDARGLSRLTEWAQQEDATPASEGSSTVMGGPSFAFLAKGGNRDVGGEDRASQPKLLLVVDQFEELFRLAEAGNPEDVLAQNNTAALFIRMLLEAVRDDLCPMHVLLSMRSEFLGDCSNFHGLAEQVNESTYLIPRMDRVSLEEVIREPIKLRGASIDPSLVQQLINQAEVLEDGLPLLQHALRSLWDTWLKRAQTDEPIGSKDLPEGSLQGQLCAYLNAIFDNELSPTQQRTAQLLFRQLSDVDAKGRVIRRRVARSKLELPELDKVVDAFKDEPRGRTFLVEENGDLDISHECLLRRWDKAQAWLKQEHADLDAAQELAEAARQKRAPWAFWAHWAPSLAGPQLKKLLAWRRNSLVDQQWGERYGIDIHTAFQYLDRSNLIARLKLCGIVGSLLLLLLGVVWMWRRAESERRRAQAQSLTAVSRSLADRSNFQLQTAALLDVEGLLRSPNPELVDTAQQLIMSVLKPEFSSAGKPVAAVAVSTDGHVFATAENQDPQHALVIVRSMPGAKEMARVTVPRELGSPSLRFDPSGTHLMIQSSDGLWVWDWRKKTPIDRLLSGYAGALVSTDARWVATQGLDGIEVADLTGEFPPRVVPFTGVAVDFAFVSGGGTDEGLVIEGGEEPGWISIYRLADLKQEKRFLASRPVRSRSVAGRDKTTQLGVSVNFTVGADGCLLIAEEQPDPRDSKGQTDLWNVCGQPHRIEAINHPGRYYWSKSADGKTLASRDDEGRVTIYRLPEIKTGASRAFGRYLTDIVLSADGSEVTTAYSNDTALVWDWGSDEVLGRAPAPTRLRAINTHGDAIYGMIRDELYAWAVPSRIGKNRLLFDSDLRGAVTSPLNDVAMAWSISGPATLWRPSSGTLIRQTETAAESAQMSDRGDRFALLSDHLRVFAGGDTKLDLVLPKDYVGVLDKNGGQTIWVKGSPGGPVPPGTVTTENVFSIQSSVNDMFAMQTGRPLSRNGRLVRQTIYWSKERPKEVPSGRAFDISKTMAIRGDGEEVVFALDGWVFRFDVNTGKKTGQLTLDYRELGDMLFSAAPLLVYDGSGALWAQPDSGRVRRWFGDKIDIFEDREIVAHNHNAIVFKTSKPQEYILLKGDQALESRFTARDPVEAVSADGNWVVTMEGAETPKAEIDGYTQGAFHMNLVGIANGRTRPIDYSGAQASQIVFSPDASLLAMGDQGGTVRVWRVADGAEVSRLTAKGAIKVLTFTNDSRRILVGGEEAPRLLQVAPLDPKELIQEVCSLVTRPLTKAEWNQYLPGETPRDTCHPKP